MINGTPDSASMGEGDAGSPGDTGDQPPATVEGVEAFWKYRQSQSDKAHAAETAALKAQIDALKSAPATPPAGESPEAARVRELEADLATERTARQALALQTKYPLTASVLGDAIANLPEEKLAAAEAAYANGQGVMPPPRIDPNMAPRTGSGVQAPAAKPINEKTKDELLADLRAMAPAVQAAAREGSF